MRFLAGVVVAIAIFATITKASEIDQYMADRRIITDVCHVRGGNIIQHHEHDGDTFAVCVKRFRGIGFPICAWKRNENNKYIEIKE